MVSILRTDKGHGPTTICGPAHRAPGFRPCPLHTTVKQIHKSCSWGQNLVSKVSASDLHSNGNIIRACKQSGKHIPRRPSTCSQPCNTHLSPHQAHVVTAQATLRRSSIREQQSWILRFGSHVASQAHSACSMCSATLLFPHPNPRRSSERLLSLSLQKLFTEPPWPSLCPVLSAWHWPWVWHSWPSTRQHSQRSRNLSRISHSPKHGAGRGPPAHKLK